jgi:hypothetical protein
MPEGIDPQRVKVHLWLGPSGVVSPLHFDVAQNLFLEVSGRKRFLLFPPGVPPILRPFPPGSRHWNLSQADPEDPAFAAEAAAARIEGQVAELGPGETLLLPALWWHQVRTLEQSLALSFWWPAEAPRFFQPDAFHLLTLLYARDRLLSLRSASLDLAARGGLLGLARTALAAGQADAAVLLAAAALEERLRQLLPGQQPDSAALVRDLPRLAQRLSALGHLTRAEQVAIAGFAGTIARAASGCGTAVEPAVAVPLVSEIAAALRAMKSRGDAARD